VHTSGQFLAGSDIGNNDAFNADVLGSLLSSQPAESFMIDQYTYARFWRCALQVNPAGYNGTYRGGDHGLDEADYNQALLQKCLELDIKVIGLADHGSVASVDALRQVLQPHGIVVFPGFEIASNDKTHYVCLFSEETTEQQLERYLGNLDLLDPTDGVHPS